MSSGIHTTAFLISTPSWSDAFYHDFGTQPWSAHMSHLAEDGASLLSLERGAGRSRLFMRPRLRRLSDRRGISRYMLVNRAVGADATEQRTEEHVRTVLRWLKTHNVQSVWVYSLTGQPVELFEGMLLAGYNLRFFLSDPIACDAQSCVYINGHPLDVQLVSIFSASRVFCCSRLARRVLIHARVDKNAVVRVCPVLPHHEALWARARFIRSGGTRRPVFACHVGADSSDSVSLFDEAVRQYGIDGSASFVVRGQFKRAPQPSESRLEYLPAYAPLVDPGMIGTYDIGVVADPAVNSASAAVFEHLASGRPVILPDTSSAADYVEPGRSGWFYKTGNAESLAAAMRQVASGLYPTRGLPRELALPAESRQLFESLEI